MRACAQYQPKFGQGGKTGMTLGQFQQMYGSDPFYNWIGLDSPLMYAAHKAAGGMTSVYRQLGIGSQWILNQILQDHLGLSKEEANWSYLVPSSKAKPRRLSLDGRIELDDLRDTNTRSRIQQWINEAADKLFLPQKTRESNKGIVIEARQGYKSKDSKRQNADISNASNAYANLYIPVLVLFSMQIDADVAQRYTQAQWLLLTGTTHGSTTDSTYVFFRDVIGYDLAAFFQRNSVRLKNEIEVILTALLTA
ncbi:hypothetical protein ICL16_27260 [Iningainema sp. BLCCT55]|uniref:Uncharacterized protein n=1 Tax=Iningainema tapete BLCC-T55 TaxID=2748662 RepID=A0A8J6XQQ9_9CYAN|nr:hypothetical protein [Iningainema tapete BLCC-T55]